MATIQIKRSANVSAPTTSDLVEGELGYSYDKSNNGAGAKLYIEVQDSGGSEVIHTVGGKYYTDRVDAATSLANVSTLVARDSLGSFAGNVITASKFIGNIEGTIDGVASQAAQLQTARNIILSGDVSGNVYFNGTQDVTITTTIESDSVALGTDTTGDYVGNVTAGTGISTTGTPGEGWSIAVGLTNTGVSSGHYGGATQIPAFEVDAQGRIVSASNVSISSSIGLAADTGAGDTLNNGDVLRVSGGAGIDTAVTDNTISVALETSGVTANTYGGTSSIPVITVDQYGRVTAAANSAISISTTLNTTDGVTDGSVDLTTGKLSFNGNDGVSVTVSGNTVNTTLTTTGVAASTYGGAATQAVFTVDAYGRITAASNVTTEIALGTNTTGAYVANLVAGTGISLSGLGNEGATPTITNDGVTSAASGGYGLTVSGATGAVTFTNTGVTRIVGGTGIGADVDTGNVTLTNLGVTSISGTGNEIVVSAANGTVQIGLPDDVTIGKDLTVVGNLFVQGNVTTINAVNLNIDDSLIYLAANNYSSDLVDIGFAGNYYDGSSQRHAGLFRDASESSDGIFKLFYNLQPEPSGTIDTANASFKIATLFADLEASNANVATALTFGGNQHKITPLTASVLEIQGGLGDASGALSLAAGNYPTSYSKLYLESGKKITAQADEFYVTLFNDGNTKLITMNTTHTAAVSTSTGALRVSGGVGITGNLYANYLNGTIDGGTY